MIEIVHANPELSDTPNDRAFLVESLGDAGLQCVVTPQPSGGHIALCFASVESDFVQRLSPATRKRVVLVAEGDAPDAAHAEETRETLGLLGLVEPRAWMSWKRGLFVAWGLYGRSDIAASAGLAWKDQIGLQPADDRDALPDVLARFLKSAELEGKDDR